VLSSNQQAGGAGVKLAPTLELFLLQLSCEKLTNRINQHNTITYKLSFTTYNSLGEIRTKRGGYCEDITLFILVRTYNL